MRISVARRTKQTTPHHMTIETQRRTQRLLIGVIVVLSSLLVAVVLVQLFPPGEPDTLTADQAARYPQTGLPALNPIRMGQANRISPAAAGNSELADFQNTVQPDEDLLRGAADPSQTAPGNTLRPAPESTGDSPVAAGPNAVPNQQPPVSGGEDLLRQLPQMDVNQPDSTPPAMTAEPLVSPPQASEPPGRIEVLPQRANPAAPGGPVDATPTVGAGNTRSASRHPGCRSACRSVRGWALSIGDKMPDVPRTGL